MWIGILVVLVFVALLVVAFIGIRKERFQHGGGVGNALQEFQVAFEPGVTHTIEEEQKEHVHEDDTGDPPAREADRQHRVHNIRHYAPQS
jgi:hypothetical protein